MKIKPENVITCADSTAIIKARTGAITRIADALRCSSKSVSRALKGEKNQVSETLYIAARCKALREEEGTPIEVRHIRL